MLSNLLGWVVAFGSLGLFLSGFFLPEVKRNNDPIWSGVGLIYALALWVNGDRTPGGLVLGEIASVALLLWFGWQMLQQRRQLTPAESQTPIPNSLETVTPFLKAGWGRIQTAYGELSSKIQGSLGEADADPAPLQAMEKDWTDEEEWKESGATPSVSVESDLNPPSNHSEPEPAESAAPPETVPTPPLDEPIPSSVTEPVPEETEVAAAAPEPPVEASVPPAPDTGEVPVEPAPSVGEPEAASVTDSPPPPTPTEPDSPAVPEPPSEVDTPDASNPSLETEPEAARTTPTPEATTGETEDDESWPPPDPIT